ncbi:hypothetical protein DEALK_17240 [Dehalogenimonas alkenigignens]|uniref:Uncharacterized protein n=1 Tax=Dehalogenimonas alkenigignens TaxID=1217799 RepID=A0A0W0GJY3_9CHLR|nr:hypothetical protein DEALK_17240 [Dehalogenimonas alkenigignens]
MSEVGKIVYKLDAMACCKIGELRGGIDDVLELYGGYVAI